LDDHTVLFSSLLDVHTRAGLQDPPKPDARATGPMCATRRWTVSTSCGTASACCKRTSSLAPVLGCVHLGGRRASSARESPAWTPQTTTPLVSLRDRHGGCDGRGMHSS